MAIQIAELPFNMLMALTSWIISYFILGLDLSGDRVIYSILMLMAVYWVLPIFGQLNSFLAPNIGIAAVFGGILLILFSLTMGFLIAPANIPVWYIWIYWINPLRYMLQGLVSNELGGGKFYPDDVTGEFTSGDDLLEFLGQWSFDERWWYCYVVVLIFGFTVSFGIVAAASRINWLKR